MYLYICIYYICIHYICIYYICIYYICIYRLVPAPGTTYDGVGGGVGC